MISDRPAHMDLSEQHYQRLQKLVTQWRYVRWFQVFFGAIVAGFGVFLVAQAHKLSAPGTWNEEAITYYPLGMILFVLGFHMILPALAQWRGDRTLVILLDIARNKPICRQDGDRRTQDGDERVPEHSSMMPPGT